MSLIDILEIFLYAVGAIVGAAGVFVLWQIFGKQIKAALKSKDKPESSKKAKKAKVRNSKNVVIAKESTVEDVIKLAPEIKSVQNISSDEGLSLGKTKDVK
jgi:uncharacterized protein YlxW (UPF0749 family)